MTKQEEFNDGLERAKKIIRSTFSEDPEDEELPLGSVWATHDETGEQLPQPGLVYFLLDPTFFDSSRDKDQLVRIVQDITSKTNASWCFLAMRAWIAQVDNPQDLPNSLEDYPGRKEIKLLIFEHKILGARILAAPITSENGKNVLGDFQDTPILDSRFKLFCLSN